MKLFPATWFILGGAVVWAVIMLYFLPYLFG
jgi:hypothetical protein